MCVNLCCTRCSVPNTGKVLWMHRSQQYSIFHHHLPLLQYHSVQLNSGILRWFWIIKSSPYTAQGDLSEKWSISCNISKQRISQSPPADGELVSPGQTQEGKNTCPLAATPHGEPSGSSGGKKTKLAPDSWGAYQRNDFMFAQTLASSHTQRSAKFLNLGYPVFFN